MAEPLSRDYYTEIDNLRGRIEDEEWRDLRDMAERLQRAEALILDAALRVSSERVIGPRGGWEQWEMKVYTYFEEKFND